MQNYFKPKLNSKRSGKLNFYRNIMKKFILFTVIAINSGLAFCTIITITNSGYAFSPDSVSINVGDTVNFDIGSIHTTVEVSQTTWVNNGNTPLPGFSTPSGGGQIIGLTAGIHYYGCSPHASSGMKGRIFVTAPSGIYNNEKPNEDLTVFPNPTNGRFTIKSPGPVNRLASNQEINIEIFTVHGEKIYSFQNFYPFKQNEIDLTGIAEGIYTICFYFGHSVLTQKFVVSY